MEFLEEKRRWWRKKALTADLYRSAVTDYAELVHANYVDALAAAGLLESELQLFIADPQPERFEKVRQTWIEARRPWLQTEAFRFSGGPIDQVDGSEDLIDGPLAAPRQIDYVAGERLSGIINQPQEYPKITKELLLSLADSENDEAIATGWHAIEFLLWGEDRNLDGPGKRPWTDFTKRRNADRRAVYLLTSADLLTDQLTALVEAWAPDREKNYRAQWNSKPSASALALVRGLGKLCGEELAEQRLLDAWSSRSPVAQPSPFSDTSHQDVIFDVLGIDNVYRGSYRRSDGTIVEGSGIRTLVAGLLPDRLDAFDSALERAITTALAIPVPFDQGVRSGENSPARAAVDEAAEALHQVAMLMADLEQAIRQDLGES
ncbi:MAG: imelysin family protein [Verrucomicrobiota bacterium]